jgi:hypothetical protein
MIKAIGLAMVALVIAGCSASAVTPSASRTSHESTATPLLAASAAVHKVGDRVKLQNVHLEDEEYFTVAKVDLAWEGLPIKVAPPAGILPPVGTNWVTVLIEIEGINPDGAYYNMIHCKVFDEQGSKYLSVKNWRSPALHSGNHLMPGEIASGWVLFEVPNTATTLRLAYSADLLGESAEIILKDGRE